MPTVPGGQRRLLFTGNVRTNLVNKYTPGSGVGALSTSTRRALKRRANAGRGTLDSNGNLVPSIPKPCCPVELTASQKIPVPFDPWNPFDPSATDADLTPLIELTGTVNDEIMYGSCSAHDETGTSIDNDITITSAGEYVIDITAYPTMFEIRTNDDCRDINTDELIITQLSCMVDKSNIDTTTNSSLFKSVNPITTIVATEYKNTSTTNTLAEAENTISSKLGITKDDIYIDAIQEENTDVAMKQLLLASFVSNCKKLMSHDKDSDILDAVVDEIKKEFTEGEELFDQASSKRILDKINERKTVKKTVDEINSFKGVLDTVNKDVKAVSTNTQTYTNFAEKYQEASKRKSSGTDVIDEIENTQDKSYGDFIGKYDTAKTDMSIQPVKPSSKYKIITLSDTEESTEGYTKFPYFDFTGDNIPTDKVSRFWYKYVEWSSIHIMLRKLYNDNAIRTYNLQADSDTHLLNFTHNGKNSIPNYIVKSDVCSSDQIGRATCGERV